MEKSAALVIVRDDHFADYVFGWGVPMAISVNGKLVGSVGARSGLRVANVPPGKVTVRATPFDGKFSDPLQPTAGDHTLELTAAAGTTCYIALSISVGLLAGHPHLHVLTQDEVNELWAHKSTVKYNNADM